MKREFIYIVIGVFCFIFEGCSPSNRQSSIHPFKSLSVPSFSVDFCWQCRTQADIEAFETGLGSKKIELDLCDLVQVFVGEKCEAYSDKDQYFKAIGGAVKQINLREYRYEAYLRPPRSAFLPREIILAEYWAPIESDPNVDVKWDSLELSQCFLKYFWKDSYLQNKILMEMEVNPAVDTNFVWAFHDSVVNKVNRKILEIAGVELQNVELNDYFFVQDGSLFPEPTYRFQEVRLSNGELRLAAPFQLHYRSRGVPFQVPNRTFGNEINQFAGVYLGWAGSSEDYERLDVFNGNQVHYFDIDAGDLAIFVSHSIY